MLCNKRSHRNEKPATTESLCTATRESPCLATKTYIQGLRLQAPSAGSQGSIPDQGTRFHMSQLRVHVSQLKIPCAATKIWHSQRNKQIHIFFKKYISSHGTPPAENPSAVPALLRIRSESQQGTHRWLFQPSSPASSASSSLTAFHPSLQQAHLPSPRAFAHTVSFLPHPLSHDYFSPSRFHSKSPLMKQSFPNHLCKSCFPPARL